jgi:hypothetical protein
MASRHLPSLSETAPRARPEHAATSTDAAAARAARAAVEAVLEDLGWPWSPYLSLFIDALVALEEATR